MSRELNVAFLCSSTMGEPGSLEQILASVEHVGYELGALQVGSFVTNLYAFWRYYDDKARQEMDIAYQKQQLAFSAIENHPVPIVLTFKARWNTTEGGCSSILYAETDDTAMFTQPQWRPEDSAQRLLILAKALYYSTHPRFAWIERCHSRGYTVQEDVDKLLLPHIYWANFFGPEYVEKLGRECLMNAPGWRIEELDDGGILYVLTPSLMGTGPKKVVEEVKTYFGIETVRRRQKGFRRKSAVLF